jgi:hypothetical protein
MAILDTLAEILRNQHILLNPKIEIDSIFFGAFAHLIFMLSDKAPDYSDDEINRQLERGSAQVNLAYSLQFIC